MLTVTINSGQISTSPRAIGSRNLSTNQQKMALHYTIT